MLLGLCLSVSSQLSTFILKHFICCSGCKRHLCAEDFHIYISNLDSSLKLQSHIITCWSNVDVPKMPTAQQGSCITHVFVPRLFLLTWFFSQRMTRDLVTRVWTLHVWHLGVIPSLSKHFLDLLPGHIRLLWFSCHTSLFFSAHFFSVSECWCVPGLSFQFSSLLHLYSLY